MSIDLGTELWALTDEQLTTRMVEVFALKAQVEAECARMCAGAQDRDLPRLAGASSTSAWIANLTKVSTYEASRTVRRTVAMGPGVEPTREAWAAGDLTGEQADVIATAVTALPDWVGAEPN